MNYKLIEKEIEKKMNNIANELKEFKKQFNFNNYADEKAVEAGFYYSLVKSLIREKLIDRGKK